MTRTEEGAALVSSGIVAVCGIGLLLVARRAFRAEIRKGVRARGR